LSKKWVRKWEKGERENPPRSLKSKPRKRTNSRRRQDLHLMNFKLNMRYVKVGTIFNFLTLMLK
jgi:hypothetical protein